MQTVDLAQYLGTELHAYVREDVDVRVEDVLRLSSSRLLLGMGDNQPLTVPEVARVLLRAEAEEWLPSPFLSGNADGLDEVYLGLVTHELRVLAGLQQPPFFPIPFRLEH